jgi:hypothetical protein
VAVRTTARIVPPKLMIPVDLGGSSRPCFQFSKSGFAPVSGDVVKGPIRQSSYGLCLLLAVLALPDLARAQARPGSVIRPGAINDIPQHLTELGWDTDLPSLFVIRFQPEKMNFEPAWSSWALELMMKRSGFMTRSRADPWPPIFVSGMPMGAAASGQLAPEDMQAFQAWCLRRSQVIPPIIVHSVPYVAPIQTSEGTTLRPFGLQPKQPKSSQVARGMGLAEMVALSLGHDADDYAASVPAATLASIPVVGVTLETRLRWSTPVPNDNPIGMQAELIVPGDPMSLRLVDDHRRVLWEHDYSPDSATPSDPRPPAKPPTPPTSSAAPDIKF